jgi:hypothetical protein
LVQTTGFHTPLSLLLEEYPTQPWCPPMVMISSPVSVCECFNV